MNFDDKELVSVPKGLLIRAYAAMATGSYVPSMFAEVRDIMINLDHIFGAQDEEAKVADRADGNGEEG